MCLCVCVFVFVRARGGVSLINLIFRSKNEKKKRAPPDGSYKRAAGRVGGWDDGVLVYEAKD